MSVFTKLNCGAMFDRSKTGEIIADFRANMTGRRTSETGWCGKRRGSRGMNLNIEIPDALEAALKAKADEQGVSASGYARQVLERALGESAEQEPRPKKSAFGLLAQYGPGPSAEEIDENRREMFRGFAEDVS